MPRYRVHYTHPEGLDTTGDYETSDRELAVDDVIEADGHEWRVREIETFEIEDYDGYVAVVRADQPEDAEA